MQRFFDAVLGNDTEKERIGKQIVCGKLPHALILEGEKGTGKKTMALDIAAALLCQNKGGDALPCRTCSACRKVLAGNAQDVRFTDKADKASIGVDTIRELRSDMYLGAGESDMRIYIIADAHTMTAQAQNALLKVLEEPPTAIVIILLAERADGLLSTIRSRSQLHRMHLLSKEHLLKFAATNAALSALSRTDPKKFEQILSASAGKAGELLLLSERSRSNALLAQRELAFSLLDAMSKRKDAGAILQLFKNFSAKRKEFIEEMGALLLALRDLCLLERDEKAPMLCFTNRESSTEMAISIGARKLHRLCASVEQAVLNADQLNANMTATTAALSAAFLA
ncbi:MAG: DNA polymerase III subunit [Clostridia bacterium]|nr:DNA polymerase III subunit [Clostridia bacterium]